MKKCVDGRVKAMMVNPALTGPGIWWWKDGKLGWHVKWGLVIGAMDISIIGGVIEWIYLRMLKVVDAITMMMVVDDFENWTEERWWNMMRGRSCYLSVDMWRHAIFCNINTICQYSWIPAEMLWIFTMIFLSRRSSLLWLTCLLHEWGVLLQSCNCDHDIPLLSISIFTIIIIIISIFIIIIIIMTMTLWGMAVVDDAKTVGALTEWGVITNWCHCTSSPTSSSIHPGHHHQQ